IPTIGGILTATTTASAQTDSLRYSQESGTLKEQRFIDRYDYVFMTKEPTKWMLKAYGTDIGASTFSSWRNLLSAPFGAIEHKLSPSFSVQLEGQFIDNAYHPLSSATNDFSFGSVKTRGLSVRLTGEVRWYYDMAKRMKAGKSANNFSGNYFSVRYGQQLNDQNLEIDTQSGLSVRRNEKTYQTEYLYDVVRQQVSLTYGLQRRFFRFGLVDMSINFNYRNRQIIRQQVLFPDGDNRVRPLDLASLNANYETIGRGEDWFIDTKLKVGMALADFKKTAQMPKCDLFRCYDNQFTMLKVSWPGLVATLRAQNLRGFLGYERKLFASPLSFNTYFSYELNNSANANAYIFDESTGNYIMGKYKSFVFRYNFSLQARYYFLLQHRIKQGKSGNHLSGLYTGLNARWSGMSFRFSTEVSQQRFQGDSSTDGFGGWGPMIGFQQKIFKNGFIDTSYTLFRNIDEKVKRWNFSDFVIRTGFAF
ncbi:MAG: hypothetical protein EAZ50_08535, partial [Runella slithyformis]